MVPTTFPQPLTADLDPCNLASDWGITLDLAERLIAFTVRAPDLMLSIISGERSDDEQIALGTAGRPTAPVGVSTHTSCPATGADLWTTPTPVRTVKARFLTEARLVGLRVGGGGPVDDLGIPLDWNHVDTGPRSR